LGLCFLGAESNDRSPPMSAGFVAREGHPWARIYGHFVHGGPKKRYAILASRSSPDANPLFVCSGAHEKGRLTMKTGAEVSRTPAIAGGPTAIGPDRGHWLKWVGLLRRYELDGVAGWLLDAGKPLAYLSAQILYFTRPFVGAGADRLARLLESNDEAAAFVALLASEHSSDSSGRQGSPQ
jgi:hypothetical protein